MFERSFSVRIFIVCPVRKVDERTNDSIHQHVLELEGKGHHVHWPFRDTDQSDTHGIAICTANREAIFAADEVHIWFDSTSQGSLFDIGMAFAFLRVIEKKVVLINKDSIKPTDHKSFNNVLLKLSE